MTVATDEETFERLGRLLDRAVCALGDAARPTLPAGSLPRAGGLLTEPTPRAARRLNATPYYLTAHPRKAN